jgi:iron-sulfur cluster assembly accessory protein
MLKEYIFWRCCVLTITDKAVDKIKAILVTEGKDKWGIKVFVAGEGCCGPSYGLNLQEDQLPDDDVIEKNGLRIYVNKEMSLLMSGMQIDYYTDEQTEGFIITGGAPSCNPAGSSSCGSGCSSCD